MVSHQMKVAAPAIAEVATLPSMKRPTRLRISSLTDSALVRRVPGTKR